MSRSVPSMPTSRTRTRHSPERRFGAGTSLSFAELACLGVTTTARIEGPMVSPKFIDITLPLTPAMQVDPGEPGPELTPLSRIADGDPANVSHLCLGTHTGTHVDAPRHFIEGGADVAAMSLDSLCGPARVVGIKDRVAVRRAELEGIDAVERVLFRTRNG